MSYIDREKVSNIIKNYGKNSIDKGKESLDVVADLIAILRLVDNMPTEDVAPIKHGKWVYEDVDIICSVCGGDGVMPWNKATQHKFPYCPHCGAKMNLESGEGR